MEKLGDLNASYLKILAGRAKKSKVHTSYQFLGLTLAELLNDDRHKALYMRLAKKYGGDHLLQLAKKISEKKNVKNKGAYFMRMLFDGEKSKGGKIKNNQ